MYLEHEKLKVVLIDDEEKGRETLKTLIEEYIAGVEVIAMAKDVLEGLQIVHQYKPDVVFLDIEMPNYSGFKFVECFDNAQLEMDCDFEIVFTTAYEKYAVKACKTSAIGYLLKPIDIDALEEIFNKIFKKYKIKSSAGKNSKELTNTTSRFVFPTQGGLVYLDAEEICYLESSGRYTDIYLISKERIVTTLSLKDCLEKLFNSTFIRIHRSFIINLFHIHHYSRGRDSFVLMDNNSKVDVGLFYKEDLNKVIASFLK